MLPSATALITPHIKQIVLHRWHQKRNVVTTLELRSHPHQQIDTVA
jgi:hypothetical protein